MDLFLREAADRTETGDALTKVGALMTWLDREAASKAAMSGDHWHDNMLKLVGSWVAKGNTEEEIHDLADTSDATGDGEQMTPCSRPSKSESIMQSSGLSSEDRYRSSSSRFTLSVIREV